MDIINELPDAVFDRIDDLLAFVSIYDDEQRTAAYLDLLERHADDIRGAVCVEAGAGFGLLSEKLAHLGAQKVYAVEANQHLAKIAHKRLAPYDNAVIIEGDIADFCPSEPVDVLVHELFGQLLFDEDVYSLQSLHFTPQLWLPDEAVLKVALLNSREYTDDVVTPQVLLETKGALIAGLFEEESVGSGFDIMRWTPRHFPHRAVVGLSGMSGDLLCFFLEIYHQKSLICRTGQCNNWAPVWTMRAGDSFVLQFRPQMRGTAVFFKWLSENEKYD